MGIRLLLLLLLAWLIWWVFKPLFQRRPRTTQDESKTIEDMVRCEYCRINLPKPEAIEEDGRFFCNEEHRQAYTSNDNNV